jgi:phage terminase large subunit-like protein
MNYAAEYTDKVLSGEIVACKKIKQAARRYRRDLKASKRKKNPWPYYFDEDFANKAIKFIELMPARDGSPLKLELYQKWLVLSCSGGEIRQPAIAVMIEPIYRWLERTENRT